MGGTVEAIVRTVQVSGVEAMSRPGGPSTAAGVSFQALCIAQAIVDVYQGRAEFVRPEAPPRADFGETELTLVHVDDYVVQRGGTRTYYQAKSNAPGGDSWTVGKLLREEVLQKFLKQTQANPNGKCCLVTPSSCDLLRSVAKQAKYAKGLEEYLANLNKENAGLFKEVCTKLSLDEVAGYEFLSCCELETRAPAPLRQDLEGIATVLFADATGAVACLVDMALRSMVEGQHLDKTTVLAYFEGCAVFAKPRASEAELLKAVKEASSRLRTVGKEIAGVHILQPSVSQAFDWIVGGNFDGTCVATFLEQGGSGKTVAMSVLLNRLERSGHVVLGIKVDGLDFSTRKELAGAIGLPSPVSSIVQSLRAAGHRVAVLIDQVDALSSAMSRHSSAITVILDLVARLANLKDVPIILACRSFDWKYDYRLKGLRDKNTKDFSLPELSDEQLGDLLSVLHLNTDDLHPLTLKVVRCPLRLSALVEITQARREKDQAWSPAGSPSYTLQSLYHELWDLKMEKAERKGVASSDCEEAVSRLGKHMHDSQRLASPETILSDKRSVRSWLTSENILAKHGKSLSFFHQTFFDFIFARQFASDQISLVKHLLSTDQGLFYRPMVRQILEYLRDTDEQRYLRELSGVLKVSWIQNKLQRLAAVRLGRFSRLLRRASGIRKHIRWLVIGWLGQQTDPRPEELNLLESFLADPSTRRRVLSHFRNNPAWFDLLGLERLKHWLRSLPDRELDTVVRHLESVFKDRQDAVASLLSPYVNHSEDWNNYIAFCLGYLRGQWAESSAELLLDLLRGPLTNLDQNQNSMPLWGRALESLAEARPKKACDAVAVILERYESKWVSKQEESEPPYDALEDMKPGEMRLPEVHDFTDTLEILSREVPSRFLQVALSWTLSTMELSCQTDNPLSFKHNWCYWSYKEDHLHKPTETLLAAIGMAVRVIAKAKPCEFRQWAVKTLAGEFEAMQYIVAEAYAEVPAEYAHDAAEFLCSDKRRLRLSTPARGNLAASLITTCSPHWNEQDLRLVETLVLKMQRRGLSKTGRYEWSGHQTLSLLLAFAYDQLSDAAKNLLRQLQRKYPDFVPRDKVKVKLRRATSPIEEDAFARMADKGWLRAMRKYAVNCDEHDRYSIACALESRAKEEPNRFYKLVLEKMDDSFHPEYPAAVLVGLAQAEVPLERVAKVLSKYRLVLENSEIQTVCRAIDKYAGKKVPGEWLEMLEQWATRAEDPQGTPTKPQPDSYLNDGVNSDRGQAVWTLAHVLLEQTPRGREEYLNFAEKVVGDPSLSVRAVCIQFLPYAVPAAPVCGFDLFKRLIGDDKVLLRERGAYNCIHAGLHRHAETVLWAIPHMMFDPGSEKAQENGAKLACLAAFNCPSASALRDACLASKHASRRKGAAAVYATNCTDADVGRECRQRLGPLMNDKDTEVREEATKFLRKLTDHDLREFSKFVMQWTKSKSLIDGADYAANTLEKHPTANPDLTLEVAARIIDGIGAELTNIQTRHGGITYYLTPAILNVYHRSLDEDIRSRAMDLFEKLEEMGCPEVRSAMDAVDRM